jgi:hypothetical protein
MIVRQDFAHLPPKPFMLQILDKTSKVYVHLWDQKDSNNKIEMLWKDISKLYHKNTFKTCLRKLNDKGLLDYKETAQGMQIELVGWDDLDIE